MVMNNSFYFPNFFLVTNFIINNQKYFLLLELSKKIQIPDWFQKNFENMDLLIKPTFKEQNLKVFFNKLNNDKLRIAIRKPSATCSLL